ncbi:BrnT family toxin [Pseudogemmobacter sonorensis]|uniref:BrnT family toxin n=1 Tax=Pseudogemmobacter sonorensis TaxID=2989681 RepID=UPI0036BCB672
MKFEWDEDKHRANIEKHGVSFEDASKIFEGFTLDAIDDRFPYGEERIISLGRLGEVVVLVVVHTERDGVCRIISARQANRKERKRYDETIQKALEC